MATLATTYPGLSVDSGTLNFGTITPGASTTQNFQITLNTLQNCLDVADLNVSVTYLNGTAEADFEITLGADPITQTGVFFDGAEGASLFTSEAILDVDDWAQVSTQANSGTSSWFAANIGNYADKSLISPWLKVGMGPTTLSFSLFYDLEGTPAQYWDGAVLELRTLDGDWVDIGLDSSVPYDGQLFGNSSLEYREAWSGTQTSWRDAVVDLGSTYADQTVQFRFRVAADQGSANVGFWVDDIQMTNVTWLESLACDTDTCSSCFGTLSEAQAQVQSQHPNWPDTNTILTFITILNNVCEP
jgi:hypothetical protein